MLVAVSNELAEWVNRCPDALAGLAHSPFCSSAHNTRLDSCGRAAVLAYSDMSDELLERLKTYANVLVQYEIKLLSDTSEDARELAKEITDELDFDAAALSHTAQELEKKLVQHWLAEGNNVEACIEKYHAFKMVAEDCMVDIFGREPLVRDILSPETEEDAAAGAAGSTTNAEAVGSTTDTDTEGAGSTTNTQGGTAFCRTPRRRRRNPPRS